MKLSSMSVLFSHSRFIVTPFLVDWLGIKEIGKLDSALCNSEFREYFVSLISSDFCVLCGHFDNPCLNYHLTYNYLEWMVSRGVTIRELTLTLHNISDYTRLSKLFQNQQNNKRNKIEFLRIKFQPLLPLLQFEHLLFLADNFPNIVTLELCDFRETLNDDVGTVDTLATYVRKCASNVSFIKLSQCASNKATTK